MSQSPSPAPASPGYSPPAPTPTNGLGMFGFIISLIGILLTCGVLCPLGLLISFFGLFKAPRGMAIAGTIIGLIGTGFLAIVFLTMGASVFALVGFGKMLTDEVVTRDAIVQARRKIEQHQVEQGALPDGVQGNKLILDFKDAWKHELRYDGEEGNSGKFVIRSAGPDGKFDTADDIKVGESPTTTSPEIEIPGMPTDPTVPEMPGEGVEPETPDKPDATPSDPSSDTPAEPTDPTP